MLRALIHLKRSVKGKREELVFSSIAVIIATHNEEEGIGPTLAELREILYDPYYLVVDGNSADKTVEIAKEFGAEVLMQEGRGKGNAISQAIERLHNEPEYVVFIDADFTYPAKYVLGMIRILEEKPHVGMVLGNRVNHMLTPEAMKDPFHMGNRFLAFAQWFLNGIDLNDPLTGLRIVRWKILKGWKPKSEGFDIEAEMNYHVEHRGYEIVEIPINYRPRLGEKKLKLRDGLSILKRMVTESLLHMRA